MENFSSKVIIHCNFCDYSIKVKLVDCINEIMKDGWKIILINYDEKYYICPKHKINLRDLI